MPKVLTLRFVFLSALFLLFTSLGFSQSTLSGMVVDNETGEPVEAATVILRQLPDSLFVTGAFSNMEGRFLFQGIMPGSYAVKVSFIGYETTEKEVFVGKNNPNYDLGKIELALKDVEEETVVIEGEANTVDRDLNRVTFDMDEQFSQGGGSVLDVMKGLPGLSVDQEGKVYVRGSDKVAVLIDGKQSSLTGFGNQEGLDNIPASNIERIEIIHNPSAKQDASGMAGIINIVYKKEQQTGFSGEAGFAFGLGRLMTRKEDLPSDLGSYFFTPKYLPSLNLNYRTKKVNVFLRTDLLQRRRLPNNEFSTRTYDDGSVIASQVAENRRQWQVILNGGIDYYLNDRNTLTFGAIYDREEHTDTSQVPYINLNTETRNRYWSWREHEITGYMNYLGTWTHDFKQPGHQLVSTLQFTRGWEDEGYFLNDSSGYRIGTDTTHILAVENTLTGMVDYTKPLKTGRIEVGTKVRVRRLPVDYTINRGDSSIIYPGLGEWSDWGENIYAGYLNYLFEKEKFEVEAGLRAEQVEVFYSIDPANIYYPGNDAYDYFQLYPNVRLTFRPTVAHHLSLFGNRRVDRPGEPQLRIFPKFDDPELLKVGNPYLRPQFTQTIELAYKHNREKGSIFIAGYFRDIDAPFLRIYSEDTTTASGQVVNKIYSNVGQGYEQGVELIGDWRPVSWWKLTGNVNLYRNTIEAYTDTLLFPYERPFSIERTVANTWFAKLTQTWEVPGDLEIQLTGQYFAPKNIPQGTRLARGSVDLGLRKGLWENRGELTFSFTDVFNTFGLREEVENEGVKVVYENMYETQVATLGFRYRF